MFIYSARDSKNLMIFINLPLLSKIKLSTDKFELKSKKKIKTMCSSGYTEVND